MAGLGLRAWQLLLGWLRSLQARPGYQFPGRQRVFGHRWRRWLLSVDDRRYRQRQTSCENRPSKHNIFSNRRNGGSSLRRVIFNDRAAPFGTFLLAAGGAVHHLFPVEWRNLRCAGTGFQFRVVQAQNRLFPAIGWWLAVAQIRLSDEPPMILQFLPRSTRARAVSMVGSFWRRL